MKKILVTCLAAALCLATAGLAAAKSVKQTSISTSTFFLDGTGYNLATGANLVDAGDYVLIEVPGAVLGQQNSSATQFISFSLSIPKGNAGQLLSGSR